MQHLPVCATAAGPGSLKVKVAGAPSAATCTYLCREWQLRRAPTGGESLARPWWRRRADSVRRLCLVTRSLRLTPSSTGALPCSPVRRAGTTGRPADRSRRPASAHAPPRARAERRQAGRTPTVPGPARSGHRDFGWAAMGPQCPSTTMSVRRDSARIRTTADGK